MRRALLIIGVAILVLVGSAAWLWWGAWPVPAGYSFPRHSMAGGPQALFDGSLEVVDGCIRGSLGEQSFAVVWPPGYRLSVEEGDAVVHGWFRAVAMGEPVRMGGGYYEDLGSPPESRDIGSCAGPFFVTTGFAD